MAPAWPWPLDAVEDWFNGLWTWIGEAANLAVSPVLNWINDGIAWIHDRVLDAAGWLWDQITAAFEGISSAVAGIPALVSEGIQGVVSAIVSNVTGLFDWLATGIHGGLEWLEDAVSGVAAAVGSAVGGLQDWVTTSFQLTATWLKDTIFGWVDGALRWASDSFEWLADRVNQTGIWIVDAVGSSVSAAVEGIGAGIPVALAAVVQPLTNVMNIFGGLYDIVNPVDVADYLLRMIGGFGFSPNPLKLPGVGTDVDVYLKNVDTWRVTMNNQIHGIATMSAVMEAVTLGQFDTSMQQFMGTPKIAAFSAATKELWTMEFQARMGIRANQALMAKYTPLLPPVVDLINFVVREVIPPEEFYATMPFLGFSAKTARDYWEAHWVLPSLGNVVDSFHRDVIPEEDLKKFMVLHDFKPEARPGISKSDIAVLRGIQKTLIPRVDLRYAWEMGDLTKEDLIERYKWLGYEDDAELMARIQLNRAMVEEINKVRNESLTYFVEGYITEETLRMNLAELGISSLRIDYYVAYALKRRQRNQNRDLLDLYRDGFVKEVLTDEEFRARVAEIIVVAEVADLYVDRAFTDKYRRPAAPRATTEDAALKELRKYEISFAVTAYRKYAIEKAATISLLIAAGVDPAVAAKRADYEELKRPLPKPAAAAIAASKDLVNVQKKVQASAVLKYREAIIDESQLYNELIETGMSEALAMATVQYELIKRGPPEEVAVAG